MKEKIQLITFILFLLSVKLNAQKWQTLEKADFNGSIRTAIVLGTNHINDDEVTLFCSFWSNGRISLGIIEDSHFFYDEPEWVDIRFDDEAKIYSFHLIYNDEFAEAAYFDGCISWDQDGSACISKMKYIEKLKKHNKVHFKVEIEGIERLFSFNLNGSATAISWANKYN